MEKRIISVLIAFLMCFSLVSSEAFAEMWQFVGDADGQGIYVEEFDFSGTTSGSQFYPYGSWGNILTSANFPDANFLAALQSMYPNGITSQSALNVMYLNVSQRGIASLKGIELFPSLTQLYCNENRLTKLDLSGNPLLEYLGCDSNKLTSLNVSGNAQLKWLSCESNQLKKLNLSGNPSLRWLYCSSNELTKLDLTENPLLADLRCSSNHLASVDLYPKHAFSSADMTPQTLSFEKSLTNGVSVVDFSQYIAKKNLGKITLLSNGFYDASTGKASLPGSASYVLFRYDTGSSAVGMITLSASLTLSATAPEIVFQPANVTQVTGGTATFTVQAIGDGLTYQWQYLAPGSSSWANSPLDGADSPVLSVPATNSRNGYQYRCVVTSSGGLSVASEAATLTVITQTSGSGIILQPQDQTGVVGGNVKFTVKASGTGLSYQWEFRENESSRWWITTVTGYNTPTLTVPVTERTNGHDYRCVVTSSDGKKWTSEPARLTADTKIAITSQPTDQYGEIGSKVKFSISASGNNLSYQWEWRASEYSPWSVTTVSGYDTPTLTVPVSETTNGHDYRCVVTSSGITEVASEPAKLIATVSVKITSQPTDQVGYIGRKVYFHVEATGNNLSYQWQWRADESSKWMTTTVSGYDTPTLAVPVSETTNGHYYRCVISSTGAKKVYSNGAQLIAYSGY